MVIGGDGKLGKVIDIRGWDSETERSVANILWQSGTANVYRLGHKGKADLKYRTAATLQVSFALVAEPVDVEIGRAHV